MMHDAMPCKRKANNLLGEKTPGVTLPLGASSLPLEPRLSMLPSVGYMDFPNDQLTCEGVAQGPLV